MYSWQTEISSILEPTDGQNLKRAYKKTKLPKAFETFEKNLFIYFFIFIQNCDQNGVFV